MPQDILQCIMQKLDKFSFLSCRQAFRKAKEVPLLLEEENISQEVHRVNPFRVDFLNALLPRGNFLGLELFLHAKYDLYRWAAVNPDLPIRLVEYSRALNWTTEQWRPILQRNTGPFIIHHMHLPPRGVCSLVTVLHLEYCTLPSSLEETLILLPLLQEVKIRKCSFADGQIREQLLLKGRVQPNAFEQTVFVGSVDLVPFAENIEEPRFVQVDVDSQIMHQFPSARSICFKNCFLIMTVPCRNITKVTYEIGEVESYHCDPTVFPNLRQVYITTKMASLDMEINHFPYLQLIHVNMRGYLIIKNQAPVFWDPAMDNPDFAAVRNLWPGFEDDANVPLAVRLDRGPQLMGRPWMDQALRRLPVLYEPDNMYDYVVEDRMEVYAMTGMDHLSEYVIHTLVLRDETCSRVSQFLRIPHVKQHELYHCNITLFNLLDMVECFRSEIIMEQVYLVDNVRVAAGTIPEEHRLESVTICHGSSGILIHVVGGRGDHTCESMTTLLNWLPRFTVQKLTVVDGGTVDIPQTVSNLEFVHTNILVRKWNPYVTSLTLKGSMITGVEHLSLLRYLTLENIPESFLGIFLRQRHFRRVVVRGPRGIFINEHYALNCTWSKREIAGTRWRPGNRSPPLDSGDSSETDNDEPPNKRPRV